MRKRYNNRLSTKCCALAIISYCLTFLFLLPAHCRSEGEKQTFKSLESKIPGKQKRKKRIASKNHGLIDLRKNIEYKGGYVVFYSRKSLNPFGVPGHCFIGWSKVVPLPPLKEIETAGFFPARRTLVQRLKSLFISVPGSLQSEPVSRQFRKLKYSLLVRVDLDVYKQSLKLRESWNKSRFKVGTSDCVSFTHSIASCVGLKLPHHRYRFPRRYLRTLTRLNLKEFKNSDNYLTASEYRVTLPASQ